MTDFGIHASSEGLICGDPLLSSLYILAGSEANQARVKGGLLEKGSRSKEAGQRKQVKGTGQTRPNRSVCGSAVFGVRFPAEDGFASRSHFVEATNPRGMRGSLDEFRVALGFFGHGLHGV